MSKTVKVKLLTARASVTEGSRQRGDVIEVSTKEADALVSLGAAVHVVEIKAPKGKASKGKE